MIKLFGENNFRIAAYITAFVMVFIFVGNTHAENTQNSQQGTQSASQENQTGNNEDGIARKYSIAFPVAELGNCSSLTACKNYCADTTHSDACIAFARKKGFYKQAGPSQDIMTAAKGELGCDSQSSCREFCGNQQNWIKCGEFAKRHNLGGNPQVDDTKKQALLEKAKQYLGCSSYDSCRAFCSQETNRIKCMELSRLISSAVGSKPPQPLPDGRPEICRNITQKMGSASADEIKAYYNKNCVQNPGATNLPSTDREKLCQQYPRESICHLTTSTESVSPTPQPSTDLEAKCKNYYPSCTFSEGVCRCGSTTGSTSSSSVRGISTARDILHQIQSWLGF